MKNLFIALLTILTIDFSQAATDIEVRALKEGAQPPPAQISQLAWIAGRWVGTGLGGAAEEVIAPAVDGQMMGMFRLANESGAMRFYEFYLFIEHGDSLALRIKHFDPKLHGWEGQNEYVNFPLVAIEENAVYFNGLTYALTDKDTLQSKVRVDGQGEISFTFKRQD